MKSGMLWAWFEPDPGNYRMIEVTECGERHGLSSRQALTKLQALSTNYFQHGINENIC
jgi:hypothetical protein